MDSGTLMQFLDCMSTTNEIGNAFNDLDGEWLIQPIQLDMDRCTNDFGRTRSSHDLFIGEKISIASGAYFSKRDLFYSLEHNITKHDDADDVPAQGLDEIVSFICVSINKKNALRKLDAIPLSLNKPINHSALL